MLTGVLLPLLPRRGELLMEVNLDWYLLLLFLEEEIEWINGTEVTMKGWALDKKSGLSFREVDRSGIPPLMLRVSISLRPNREAEADAEADALSVF